MIKVAAFKPEDYEEANKFLEKHPNTAGDGKGLAYCNNYILVSYEDGNLFPAVEQRTRAQSDLTVLYKQRFDSVREIAMWKAQLDTYEPLRVAAVEKLREAFTAYTKKVTDDKFRTKLRDVLADPTPEKIAQAIQSISHKEPETAMSLSSLQIDVEKYRMRASEANASYGMQQTDLEITEIKIATAEKLLKAIK